MSQFTADNTEGFSAADLRVLNEVFDRLISGYRTDRDGEGEKTLCDKITNAWSNEYVHNTVDALIREVGVRFHGPSFRAERDGETIGYFATAAEALSALDARQ